jgi:hypothetical protein
MSQNCEMILYVETFKIYYEIFYFHKMSIIMCIFFKFINKIKFGRYTREILLRQICCNLQNKSNGYPRAAAYSLRRWPRAQNVTKITINSIKDFQKCSGLQHTQVSQKYRVSLKVRHPDVSRSAEKYFQKSISFIFEEMGLKRLHNRGQNLEA